MVFFRPCPSYPGYSASDCGQVRRDPFVTRSKSGSEYEAKGKVLKRLGYQQSYVALIGLGLERVKWRVVVADAWPDGGRPEPSYADGRVLTLAEYWSGFAHPSIWYDRGKPVCVTDLDNLRALLS